MRRVFCMCALLAILAALAACGDGDYKRRHENTLKSFESAEGGGEQLRLKLAACVEKLGAVKDAEELKTPGILYAEWHHAGAQILIFVDWMSLRPMADGIVLKCKKGVAKHTFSPEYIAENDEAAKDMIAFKGVVLFPAKDMPPFMYEKDLVVILAKNGKEISPGVPLKKTDSPVARRSRR